jgi:hypothetical protein
MEPTLRSALRRGFWLVIALIVGALTFGYWGVGVAFVVVGMLWVGEDIFTTGKPPKYRRPTGQMVIATLLNLLLAGALCVLAIVLGTVFSSERIVGGVSHATMILTVVVIVAGQGLALPLYAWWHWSGERA